MSSPPAWPLGTHPGHLQTGGEVVFSMESVQPYRPSPTEPKWSCSLVTSPSYGGPLVLPETRTGSRLSDETSVERRYHGWQNEDMDETSTRSFTDRSSTTYVGRFTYRPDTDQWIWSDGMYRIHGFEPHEVVPSTELVMRHIHPDDRPQAWASRDEAIGEGSPFTFPHRIINARGNERIVIAAGHSDSDDDGACLVGHLIDVTEFRRDAVEAEVDQAVAHFNAQRAVMEQAKGILMQLYSVDADTAWQMLRAYSQDHNRKVRDVAAVLIEAATDDRSPSKEQRGVVHEVLDRLIEQAEA